MYDKLEEGSALRGLKVIDMGQMVAEDKHVYVANLPNYMDEKAELVRCMKIQKADDDGFA